MSKDGVYSPFKPIRSDRDFGVKVTDRYDLGQHADNFTQEPVTSWDEEGKGDRDLLLFGWAFDPDDVRLYRPHHSWHMSKLYRSYSNGTNFRNFWTLHSNYCEPTRSLHYVRHGGDFPNVGGLTYGNYESKLYEVFTDGGGGYSVMKRPIGTVDDPTDYTVVEDHEFDKSIMEQVFEQP